MKSIESFESFVLQEHILSENFLEYSQNNQIENSQLKSKIVCIFCWLTTIRWLLGAFISDPNILILIGGPLYLAGDRFLSNLSLFEFSLLGSLFRTLFIIGL